MELLWCWGWSYCGVGGLLESVVVFVAGDGENKGEGEGEGDDEYEVVDDTEEANNKGEFL